MKERIDNFSSYENGPHTAEMDAYDEQYFAEHPDQNGSFPVDPEAAYEAKPLPTVPMDTKSPAGNDELDTVNKAVNLDEALREYKNRYSLRGVARGKQSPQLAAEMLLGIADKFREEMTPRQTRRIALETIRMGEAIISLADKPAEKSKEWANIKGLMELSDIITLAQTYTPEKVEALTIGLRHVANKVDSRSPAISGPIIVALDTFDSLPDSEKKPFFDDILEEVERRELNESDQRYMERQAQLEREHGVLAAAAQKEREVRLAAAEERLAQRKERMLQELADAAMRSSGDLAATGMITSAKDLFADDDSSLLTGVK